MTFALTDAQRELADQRASAVVLAATEYSRRHDGFLSIRDTRQVAKEVGVSMTDWRVERDMVRAAGFGRLKTSAMLGDWEVLVAAPNEASRWYDEPIDLVEVSRRSLAWLLADRPDGPMYPVRELSREIAMLDSHIERPEKPTYRELLDAWRDLLDVESGPSAHDSTS
jgi:hypothetical protein